MTDIFNDFALLAGSAVTSQVISHIKRKLLSGELSFGDELPSRRKLAVMLGINPNTVQKIYKQLEDDGVIETTNTSKSVVCANTEFVKSLKDELTEEELKKTLYSLKQSGVTFKELIDMIAKLWEE